MRQPGVSGTLPTGRARHVRLDDVRLRASGPPRTSTGGAQSIYGNIAVAAISSGKAAAAVMPMAVQTSVS